MAALFLPRLADAGFHSSGFPSSPTFPPPPPLTAPDKFPTSYTPAVQGAGHGGYLTPGVASQIASVPGTALVGFSDDASRIVGGMAESFLGGEHGVLTPSELQCLGEGAGKLAGGVMDTAGRTAQTMHILTSQKSGDALAASMAAAQAGMNVNPNNQNPVDPLIAGIEISQRLSSMMEFEEKISSKCLKEDAKAELKSASQHLGNLSFMGGRLVANGVDIMTDLGKAAGAYDNQNYRLFGDMMGLAARKVLLSQKGEGIQEITGIKPTAEDVADVTNGLVRSLFKEGMTLQVSSDALTTMAPLPPQYMAMYTPAPGTNVTAEPPPTLVPWTLLPAAEVNVDLHQCVAGNKELFKDAWTPVWNICSKMAKGQAVSMGTADMSAVEKATGEGAEGFGALAMSMLDAQIALRRCGFTAEQEAILYDAFQAGGKSIHTKFESGDHQEFTKGDMSEITADAIDAWKGKNFQKFGQLVGQALRDITIETFPEKYYVDSDGRLRQRLVQLSKASTGSVAMASGSMRFVVLAFISFILAIGLVIRGRGHLQWYREVHSTEEEQQLDLELAKGNEAIE
jgi:hypothetical protein